MSRMPRQNWHSGFPPQGSWPPPPPRQRKVRWKLRPVWIILPLLVLAGTAVIVLLSNVDFDFDIDLDLGWDLSPELTGLLVLGLILIVIVGILRILRGKR